jgi:hypothetical protein
MITGSCSARLCMTFLLAPTETVGRCVFFCVTSERRFCCYTVYNVKF